MEHSDEALVAEYLAGDEGAFAHLLTRHLKSVYSFAVRLVGDEAEDIVQDTFLKAWKNLKKYEPATAQFKTWLMRIARNTVIDHLRKRRPYAFSEFEEALDERPDTGPLPDELVARAHDAQDVENVLGKLAPHYREVVLLRYMNQLSFEEIASILNESPNTVRSRHRRALAQLRTYLEALHQTQR